MDKTLMIVELEVLRAKIEDVQREQAEAVSSFLAAQVELQAQLAAAHAENAELRAALKPLVRLLRHIPRAHEAEPLMDALDVSHTVHDDEPTVGELRRAADLLATPDAAQVRPGGEPKPEEG